jgi:hypothetical protein
MKTVILSLSAVAALAFTTVVGSSTASAAAIIHPPNPFLGEPLSVLIAQDSGTEATLLVSVMLNPGAVNPGPPDLEIVTPGLAPSR